MTPLPNTSAGDDRDKPTDRGFRKGSRSQPPQVLPESGSGRHLPSDPPTSPGTKPLLPKPVRPPFPGAGDDSDKPDTPDPESTTATGRHLPAAPLPPGPSTSTGTVIQPSGINLRAEEERRRVEEQLGHDHFRTVISDTEGLDATETHHESAASSRIDSVEASERAESARAAREAESLREAARREEERRRAAVALARIQAIEASERSESARGRIESASARESGGRQAIRNEAAQLFESAVGNVDTNAAEEAEAERLSAKIRAGRPLDGSEQAFVAAALAASEENETIRAAQEADEMPALAMGLAGTALSPAAVRVLSPRQATVLFALITAGVVADANKERIQEILANPGFRAPEGAEVSNPEGIDRPADVPITTLQAPANANIQGAEGFDQPVDGITGGSIDVPTGTGFTVGIAQQLRQAERIAITDQDAALSEALRLLNEAIERRANAAAELSDAREEALDADTDEERRDAAARAQNLEQELESLDASRERALALRSRLLADASSTQVASQGFSDPLDGVHPVITPANDPELQPDISPAGSDIGSPQEDVGDPNTELDQFDDPDDFINPNDEIDDMGDDLPDLGDDLGIQLQSSQQVDVQTRTADQTDLADANDDLPDVNDDLTQSASAAGASVPTTATGAGVGTGVQGQQVTLTGATGATVAAGVATPTVSVAAPIVKLGGGALTDRPLMPGENVEIAQFRQGPVTKQVNLSRGTIKEVPESSSRVPVDAPVTDIRVVKLSPRPVRRRRFDIGALVATIGPSGTITFEEDLGQRGVVRESERLGP